MKRPIVVIAVGYIIGIVWGLYCECSIALLYAIIIPISFLSKIIYKSNNKFKLFSVKRYIRYLKIFLTHNVIFVIIVSSIISNTIVSIENKRYNQLFSNITNTSLTGIVISNVHSKEYFNVYKVKIENLNGNPKYKNTYVFVYIPKDNNIVIDYGDEIEVKGKYSSPAIQRNYGGFDYKEYLKTQKIYGIVKANSIKTKNKEKINIISLLSNKIFLKIKNNIETVFPDDIANLTLGIILGYKDNLDEKMQQDFIDSNMAYILAVSGMHVSYIVSGLIFILKMISIGKRKAKIIAIIVLVAYMFITGFTPSVVRATMMAILYLGSSLLYRKNDVWNSIAISLLFILIYNPFLLKSASLVLSYVATIGIIVFNKTFTEIQEKYQIKDKKIKYKIYKKLKEPIHFVISSIAITFSAQISIIPIFINNFNKISLSFLITNLAVSLLIGPIIIIGLITIICSVISTNLLNFLLIIITPFLKILVLISKLSKELPLSKIYFETLNLFQIIVYYIIIFSINFLFKIYNTKHPTAFQYRIKNIMSLIKYRFKQKKFKYISSVLIICLIISIYIVFPKNLRIHFIDVGQGDSTLIVTPMNKSILIDGGGSSDKSFDVGKSTLLPYLLDRGITKIDYIFVSHFDQDHVRTVCSIY